jgi:AAA domain
MKAPPDPPGNGNGAFDPMETARIISAAAKSIPPLKKQDLEMGLDDWAERLTGQPPEAIAHSIAETIDLITPVCDDPGAEIKAALTRAGLLPEEKTGDHVFIDWSTFWDRDRSEAEWVYPDVLARGRGHALYAVHKTGKSLLMLYLAAEIATGPEPSVVVYLDYEMTEVDVFDRLDDMGYGPDTDFSRLRYALLPTLPPLDTAAGAEALTELVDGVQSEWPEHHVVVVIDTISRAVRGKENDADTFRDFYFHTGIRLKRRGITWARLDHGGKSPEQGQRGSSSKGDDVDVVWKLTKTQNGVTLHRELSRMEWVPENVVLGRFDDPLRYLRLAGDWPDGTGETANILSRLGVPLDASTRVAQKALKDADEGRRRAVVSAALQWRREKESQAHGVVPGTTGTQRNHPNAKPTEPPRNQPLFEAGNHLGTTGTTPPVQMGGGKKDPLKGGLSSPPPSTTENDPSGIEMGDMP